MYHSGFDVHDDNIVIQHMDEDGALGVEMTTPTTKKGMCNFLSKLDAPSTITLEASDQYWWISQFLEEHPLVSKVNVVDPRRSRKLSEELSVQFGYGRAKNDRIDAEMEAHQSRLNLLPAIHVPTAEQMKPRSLNRHRFELVHSKTRATHQIQGLLKIHGISVSSSELLGLQIIQQKVLERLPDYGQLILKNLLRQVPLFEDEIEITEAMLDTVYPESHPDIKLLMTHPGIGIVYARTIRTEIRDIGNFSEPKYLISYSGLAPVEQDSNGTKGVIKLNQFCNYYLKYAFIGAAHCARNHPRFKSKYEKDLKKHDKIIAKLNIARRIAKSVYWMLTRQEPFKE